MAILLPIYVILVTAAIYLGEIGLMKIGAQKIVGYAAAQRGTEAKGPLDNLTPVVGITEDGLWFQKSKNPYPKSFEVPVVVTEFNDPGKIDEEMWSAGDIDGVLEEIARAPVGHYEYDSGEITYVLDEDRLSAYGEYIFDNNLQMESANVAEILAGWIKRSGSTISCRYRPGYSDWDFEVVWGKWEDEDTEGRTDISSFEGKYRSSSYISGDKDRGSHPPDNPDFNREIFNMLSGSAFPDPIDTDPSLFSSQSM